MPDIRDLATKSDLNALEIRLDQMATKSELTSEIKALRLEPSGYRR